MKIILSILILIIMVQNSVCQKTVYDKNNKSLSYLKEDQDLLFEESKIIIPPKETTEIAAIATLMPAAVDLGFKIATNMIEKRQKSFTGEYVIQKSNLKAGSMKIPDFTFTRNVELQNDLVNALRVEFKAKALEYNVDGFVYYIESIQLDYSKAKTTKKSRLFDYTFEIKPTFYINGEKVSQELFPITVHSVEFGSNNYNESYKHRTDIIPLPRDGMLSEISVKIIEVNPCKVNTEKIYDLFNTYGEDVSTIINNYIEKKIEQSDSTTNDSEEPSSNELDSNLQSFNAHFKISDKDRHMQFQASTDLETSVYNQIAIKKIEKLYPNASKDDISLISVKPKKQ